MLPGRTYTFDDISAMIRRRAWVIAVPVLLAAVVTGIVLTQLPDRFRSDTLILVVPQRVPESYVQATVTTRIEDRLQSISQRQWEAGAALGLTYRQRLFNVVLPQAIRISVAPTVGFLVQLVKNTSLAALIGFIELTRASQIISGATFAPLPVFLSAAAIYFVICFSISQLSQKLERRLRVAR